MPKKCIICEKEATYKVKGSSDYYCVECAKENFSDVSFLQKVEEEAQQLKQVIKERMNGNSDTQEH